MIAAKADWRLTILIAAIPAIASVVAAIVASRAAQRAKRAEVESARLRQLEERIASKRYDIYRPVIEMLRDMFSNSDSGVEPLDTQTIMQRLADFTTWVAIYGSDEALRSFRNFMQAAFHNPPDAIGVRLYADFVLAARRDMGYVDTTVTGVEILGLRIKDIHDDRAFYEAVSLPFDEVCSRYDWIPPWERTPQSPEVAVLEGAIGDTGPKSADS